MPKFPSPFPRMPVLPRGPRRDTFTRGPTALWPAYQGAILDPSEPGPKPAGMVATEPEWRVYWWLTKHKNEVGEFDFQSSLMGGRLSRGGLVMDFILLEFIPQLAINVQGEYWHFGSSILATKDRLTKERIIALGMNAINVREQDLLDRLDYTMRNAINLVQLYGD